MNATHRSKLRRKYNYILREAKRLGYVVRHRHFHVGSKKWIVGSKKTSGADLWMNSANNFLHEYGLLFAFEKGN